MDLLFFSRQFKIIITFGDYHFGQRVWPDNILKIGQKLIKNAKSIFLCGNETFYDNFQPR